MREVTIETADGAALDGFLGVPERPQGLVVFVHGSGSSRHSPRNRQVADRLVEAGQACLLFDLLTAEEGAVRRNVFDIPLLSERVGGAVDWAVGRADVGHLAVGLFGASTGAAAALETARDRPERIRAVVSRGGRPDLATDAGQVEVPVLLIVGGEDRQVLELNRDVDAALPDSQLEVIPGAGHLFEGPGELEEVADLAAAWFTDRLPVTM